LKRSLGWLESRSVIVVGAHLTPVHCPRSETSQTTAPERANTGIAMKNGGFPSIPVSTNLGEMEGHGPTGTRTPQSN